MKIEFDSLTTASSKHGSSAANTNRDRNICISSKSRHLSMRFIKADRRVNAKPDCQNGVGEVSRSYPLKESIPLAHDYKAGSPARKANLVENCSKKEEMQEIFFSYHYTYNTVC